MNFVVSFVHREANFVEHIVAKYVITLNSLETWMEEGTDWLVQTI